MKSFVPTVSVITAAFNAEKTINDCIGSVRDQSYRTWEHIIVDDGSTDATWELIRDLPDNDPRFRVIRQANGGPSKARNTGIRAARGKYIAFLDSDDRALPGRLQIQLDYLETHPEVDVLGSAYINVSGSQEVLCVTRPPSGHSVLAADIFRRNPFCTSTVMARQRFFSQLGGFAEDLPRAEDYDLWFQGYRDFCYDNLQEPLVYYRRDARPSWRNSAYSARVILRAIKRDGRPLWYLWYPCRQLLGTFLAKAHLKKRWY